MKEKLLKRMVEKADQWKIIIYLYVAYLIIGSEIVGLIRALTCLFIGHKEVPVVRNDGAELIFCQRCLIVITEGYCGDKK